MHIFSVDISLDADIDTYRLPPFAIRFWALLVFCLSFNFCILCLPWLIILALIVMSNVAIKAVMPPLLLTSCCCHGYSSVQ